MIRNQNGRLRSVRTADEIEKLLQEQIDNLEPSERAVLELILKELRGEVAVPDGEKPLIDVLGDAEFKHKPVDMRTFITDPYYLGEACKTLYPKLADHLVEIFEGDYEEIYLVGAIGTGKTFTSTVGISRVLYEISCLRDPHASYGIAPGSPIDIVCVSVKETLAQTVAFENIATKIKDSPYFQEHFPFELTKKEIVFPNNVRVAPLATTTTSALGKNVHTAFIDEADFMPVRRGHLGEQEEQSDSIHASILSRMQSRFGRRGRLPGKLFIASSKTTAEGFTSKRLVEAASNPKIYSIDYCLTGDTKIPLLDGTVRTIKELAEGAAGPEFWVYSLDTKTQRVVPGKAIAALMAHPGAQTYCVTLDNGATIRATGNHPFMLRDGTYRRVDELKSGDSLMPLYRRLNPRGYEQVAHPGDGGKWQTTHRMSIDAMQPPWPYRGSDGHLNVVHHKNCNKRDNRPENLQWMGFIEHQDWHRSNMSGLIVHSKSPEHRKWAAKHMKGLHADPMFAAKRDNRSRKTLLKLREDPEFCAKQVASVRGILTDFHRSEEGKKAQTARNVQRWDNQGRKTDIERIQEAAYEGVSISVLAQELGCSPGAITQRLKRAGLDSYSVMKKAAGHPSNHNHKVVSIELAEVAPVYDLTIEEHHNFALESGIFVSNSNWDVKPDTYYKKNRFHVLCGTADVASKILTPEEYESIKDKPPEGSVIVEVPEDYRISFELDLEKSIRDIAGIATVSVRPYIQRREKIKDAIQLGTKAGLRHPFSTEFYDMSKGGTFLWDMMVGMRQERAGFRMVESKVRPRLDPGADRHVHLDIGIRKDSLGFCLAHISGFKQVIRQTEDGRQFFENAPIYTVDCLLRVIPPQGGEIILAEARHLVYDLIAHGYVITSVSFDSYQSTDSIQQMQARGLNAQIVSVDTTPDPYDVLKTALYEDRVIMYDYPHVQKELSLLQEEFKGGRRKIDHPPKGSKDVSDALAGTIFTLSQQKVVQPLPIMRGSSYSPTPWIEESRSSNQNYGTQPLPPFLMGNGGGWGDPWDD